MSMSNMISLGEKIRIYRKRAGLTQTQLAERVGVSKSTISNYESDITEPTLSQMIQMAAALDTPLDYLMPPFYEPPAVHIQNCIPLFDIETALFSGNRICGEHIYINPGFRVNQTHLPMCAVKAGGRTMLFMHETQYRENDILLCANSSDGRLAVVQYRSNAFWDVFCSEKYAGSVYVIAKYICDIAHE